MAGIELQIPCRPIVIKMLEKGCIVNCTAENTVRLLPPLIVKKKNIDRLIKNLHNVLIAEDAK